MTEKNKTYTKRYVNQLRAQINRLNAIIQKYDSITLKQNSENKASTKKKYGLNFWINFIFMTSGIVIATFAVFQYFSFQDFTKKNNRAYIIPISISSTIPNLKNIQISPSFKNVGKTPAYNVIRKSSFAIGDENGSIIKTFHYSQKDILLESGIVAGSEPISFTVNYSVPDTLIADITTKQKFLAFYGLITFTDIYDDVRCFKFAFKYQRNIDTFTFNNYGNEPCDEWWQQYQKKQKP